MTIVRTRALSSAAGRCVYIAGQGLTKVSRKADTTLAGMGGEAIKAALKVCACVPAKRKGDKRLRAREAGPEESDAFSVVIPSRFELLPTHIP